VSGAGIQGVVSGHCVIVGSPRFVREQSGSGCAFERLLDASLTPVLVAVDGAIVAAAGIGDPIRPDAPRAVAALRARGWTVDILSGDARGVVDAVGRALELPSDRCTGGASPETKRAIVERAASEGTVVMVGDGINDAAAIAAASVGIGVHGGAEACLTTADIYLTTPGLSPVVDLVTGAKRAMRVIRRNIALSIVYNAVGAGLAMTGHLTPLVAAILMPASSLTVVYASWRGRAFREVRA
jgi:Cu2+-exporting ATPase